MATKTGQDVSASTGVHQDTNPPAGEKNEGEGSQTGARQYNESTKKFVADGKVDEAAREAVQSIEGAGAEELKKAEAEGKRHAHGEDPALKDKAT